MAVPEYPTDLDEVTSVEPLDDDNADVQ